jgi:hypothetical protein
MPQKHREVNHLISNLIGGAGAALPKKWTSEQKRSMIFLNAPLRCALAFGREEWDLVYAHPGLTAWAK